MTRDPVCCTDVDEHHARSRGLYTEHEGQSHYFCCTECLMRFREQPEQYLTPVSEWYATFTMTDDYFG